MENKQIDLNIIQSLILLEKLSISKCSYGTKQLSETLSEQLGKLNDTTIDVDYICFLKNQLSNILPLINIENKEKSNEKQPDTKLNVKGIFNTCVNEIIKSYNKDTSIKNNDETDPEMPELIEESDSEEETDNEEETNINVNEEKCLQYDSDPGGFLERSVSINS